MKKFCLDIGIDKKTLL
jgi:hypothetical protein